jgi:ribosomal protein L2
MALIKAKPTSPGRRFVVSVKTPGLHKGKPFAGLIEKKSTKRNPRLAVVTMLVGSLRVT